MAEVGESAVNQLVISELAVARPEPKIELMRASERIGDQA